MGAVNPNHLATQPAMLYVAELPSNLAAINAGQSNLAAVRTDIEAKCTFTRLASVVGLKATADMAADLKEIIADDTGTIWRAVRPVTTVEATWYESGNEDARALLTGRVKNTVAGSATPVTDEAHGTGLTVGQPFKLNNKDGDNTIVASIVVEEDGTPLTVTTDYTSYVGDGTNGELGYTYIVPVTAQTGAITVSYSYTPNAAVASSLAATTLETPRLVVKIATAADENGKVNYQYLVDASVSGSIVDSFLDPSNNDLEGSPVELMTNKGGYSLRYSERV